MRARGAGRDFADDTKDAGEMGAGHTVTALYDVTLTKSSGTQRAVDPLRYQNDRAPTPAASSGELLTSLVRELAESAASGAASRERLELIELIDSAKRLGLGG